MGLRVAFLRAINTPPRHVRMDRLLAIFTDQGFDDVETVIASGNVLFRSRLEPDATAIEGALERALGFDVPVFLRTAHEVADAARPPFDIRGPVEVSFLHRRPDDEAVRRLLAGAGSSDHLEVVDRRLYWMRAGPGSTHSERRVARTLGMPTTRRSLATVCRVADRLGAVR